jgi:hypothetical protein
MRKKWKAAGNHYSLPLDFFPFAGIIQGQVIRMSSQTRPDFSDPSHSVRSLHPTRIKKYAFWIVLSNVLSCGIVGWVEDKCHGILSRDSLNGRYRLESPGGTVFKLY